MKVSKLLQEISLLNPEDEIICAWFGRDDFPIGISEDGEYDAITHEAWNRVVSLFQETKWADPLTSSWAEVHKEIYKLVGEETNATV
jgi:hypothetical protein